MRTIVLTLACSGALACGGGGSASTSPTSPTSTTPPAAAVAAEYAISVSVGSRPAQALFVSTPQAQARASATIEIVERRNVLGEVRKLVASLKKGGQTVFTETLEDAVLRNLIPGGSLAIPGGGRVSIPYTPRFPFTRDDALIIDVQGEFRDSAGNISMPVSPPVPVPVDNIATCFADPNHLCLNNQRFQVDVLINGARVTAMQRESDTDGRWVSDELILIAKVLNACGLTNRYRVELAVNSPRLAFTVFVTDTLAGVTRSYLTGSPAAPVIDTSAFATCP